MMIITKLKQQYPSSIETLSDSDSYHNYFWISKNKKQLGIPLDQLSDQEQQLLTILVQSDRESESFNQSEKQQQWYAFFHQQGELPLTNWKQARLLFFSLTNVQSFSSEFQQALLSFFSEDAILVWIDYNTGVIIEAKQKDHLDLHEFQEIMATLDGDFYHNIHFYIGNFHTMNNDLLSHYQMEYNCFQLSEQHTTNTKLHTIKSTFPYLLLDGMKEQKEWFIQQLLGKTVDDQELLKTVKTYIQCNRNATLAAKELYIHRNSLQYRIDKFIEKTNLDIKDFHDATLAYLAITLL